MKKILMILAFCLVVLLPLGSDPLMDFEKDDNTYWNSYIEFTLGDDMYLINEVYTEMFSEYGSQLLDDYLEEYDPITLAIIIYGKPLENELYGIIFIALDKSDLLAKTEYNKDYAEANPDAIKKLEKLFNSVRDDLSFSINLETLGSNTYTVNKYSTIGTPDKSVKLEYVSGIGRRYYPCITAMLADAKYKSAVDRLVTTIEYKTRVDK